MKSALITLIEAMPSSLPVLWLTTLTLDKDAIKEVSNVDEETSLYFSVEDSRLAKLINWFSGILKHSDDHSVRSHHNVHLYSHAPNTIFLEQPTENDRRRVFTSYFSTLHLLPEKLYEARMQVIKARIQIHKPCIPQIEKPAMVEQSTSSSPQGSRNKSLRSGVSCKNQYQGGKESASRQQHQPMLMTEDGDKQCVRELRNFLRATLGELHKEKKCLVFWRPVDPENVPDYYDVISCPMDLETMRMKVNSTKLCSA